MPMESPMVEVLYDEAVLPSVIELAESARSQLVLVSPYNDFPGHLRNAVEQAAKRRVSVTAVCRSDHAQSDNAQRERAHREWLTRLEVRVYLVEQLHSKIYLNESQAIVTSMNLLKGSAVDLKEVALRVRDTKVIEEINNYIKTRLIDNAANVDPKPRPSQPSARPDTAGVFATVGKSVLDVIKRRMDRKQGYCIRCGNDISFNTKKPYCLDCYHKWDRSGRKFDYPERHCHRCGRESQPSFVRPQCLECFKETR